jgi:hypothetical protein
MKDVFNHLLHEAALAHEKAPAMPVPAASVGPLPRSILHTRRDDPFDAGSIWVLGGDPAYPVALLAAGVQGEVEVRVELGDAGAIDRVVVQRDDSGYPALADAAQDIARHRLAEMHLDKVDPAKLPAVVTLSVNFQRNDPRSVAALDCATYRVDAAAWRGDRPRLPDFQSLIDLLGSRAFGAMGADARLPRRSAMMFGAQDSVAEMKALDAACDAAPRKLAIDAIIDAIDAMPESR